MTLRLLLFLTLLCCVPVKAQVSERVQSGQKTDNQQGATNSQATQAGGQFPILQTSKPEQQSTAGRQGEKSDDRVRTDDVAHLASERTVANFTVVLAIATILLMVGTTALWWETRKLAKFARVQAEDTKTSIDIAKTVAESTAIAASSTRAWLTLSGFSSHSAPNLRVKDQIHKEAMVMMSSFTNSGDSPAIFVSSYSEIKVGDKSDNVPIFIPDLSAMSVSSGSVGPKMSVSSGMLPLAGKELIDVMAGVASIFMYTIITYRDIFGKSHKTEICYRADINGSRVVDGKPPEPDFAFFPVGLQNELD